jgi:hypothetical protein
MGTAVFRKKLLQALGRYRYLMRQRFGYLAAGLAVGRWLFPKNHSAVFFLKMFRKKPNLRALAGTVQAFENYESPGHMGRSIP